MTRILFINNSLSNGGSERVMALLANEFGARGYSVDMLIQNRNAPETYKLNENIEKIFFNSKNTHGISYTFRWMETIRKTIRRKKYEVVVSFIMQNNVLTLLAALGLNTKIIVSERCNPSRTKDYGFFFKAAEQLLYPRAYKVVVQTPDVKDYYKLKIRKRCKVIPNPVNPELPIRDNEKNDQKIIVTAGRLEEQKNYPMLLEAFKRFGLIFPDYRLEIYGQGSLWNELNDLCEKMGIQSKVFFKGYVENVEEYIKKASMFVLASNYEGISNTMMEAMAMGVPTICTDCPVGGARLMIKSGENGLLVPVGDIQGLTDAMIEVATHTSWANAIGKEALKIRIQYSIERIADEWETFFN